MPIRCQQSPVLAGSAALAAMGALVLCLAKPSGYGKYSEGLTPAAPRLPARAAWFLQELPSFAVPAGILARQPRALLGQPATVLLGLFCAHYFHRTFIYSLLTRGRPFPVVFLVRGFIFCAGNGLLQGYYLIYCAEYPAEWYMDVRFSLGIFLFILGMGINIHSDYILRQLRKPGEVTYRIPQGGLFTYVSGANFLGEIIEWIGYALATWSLPALAFAFFSLCFLGLRAFHHHRFYLKMFEDYPKSRKALIPFLF
ncbi:3-oxo-5-alpha-steroid 4-dehydrogenase 2 isoform X1 [Vulpes vulpes]|uniref:3-oxo-5-alpha-steroid 4-dehydrogenase n=1 Tax=Vulpes vulpes TaxID=9627 RepID=A0A3Q7T4B7_VULVU|nr:3-oxo-5-alpha-steroid 4-dehydrogenase 2 [Vulpes vulpes]XP_041612703.1 3-oxo-5-alpha-steroid 4-dehydrogenase 2 isoform X1 [Vulpes lagopus]